MNETLAPNQYATYEEYDRAYREHNREAAGILHEFIGALQVLDKIEADTQRKAQAWDSYAEMVREWDAKRPVWVR